VRGDRATRRERKRADYLLRFTRDFPIAVVEAKPESEKAATGWRPSKDDLDRYQRRIPDELYGTADFERKVALLKRTEAIARHLTDFLKKTDRFAKTIVFCVDQEHASEMRTALNNLDADLVGSQSPSRQDPPLHHHLPVDSPITHLRAGGSREISRWLSEGRAKPPDRQMNRIALRQERENHGQRPPPAFPRIAVRFSAARTVSHRCLRNSEAHSIAGHRSVTDGPIAKAIVFCVDQEHACEKHTALNNMNDMNADLFRQHADYVRRVTTDERDIGRGHMQRFQDVERRRGSPRWRAIPKNNSSCPRPPA
jgi:type I site-specific restriction endonuclease